MEENTVKIFYHYGVHLLQKYIICEIHNSMHFIISKAKSTLLINRYTVGLGVTCSSGDPRFAGSNPAEVDGFFLGRKNSEHKSSGRDFKLGGSESEISGSLKNLKPEKIGL